jgi:hypothetical protein
VNASESQTAKTETPAPKLAVRLAFWCGIYLCAAIFGAVTFMRATGGDIYSIDFLQVAGLSTISFPCWLALPFVPRTVAAGTEAAFLVWPCALAYDLYVVHLWFTWNVKTRRAFRNVMLGFVVIVGLNLIGCHELTRTDDTTNESESGQIEN